MKASLFCTNRYLSREAMVYPGWPVPPALFRPDIGLRSFSHSLEQVRLADDLGFDWVSCSEHHYTPMRQTPNATVFAAALTRKIHQACEGSERGSARSARRRKSQIRGGRVSFLAATGLAEAVKRLWGRARGAGGPARRAWQANESVLRAAARSGHASA